MINSATKTKAWILTGGAATLLAVAAWQTTFAQAAPEVVSRGCKQWQTATFQPTIDINAPLPEVGKPHVDTAPEGWEPFALGHGGMLVYKRCVK